MAQDIVVGIERWCLRHPLLEGGRHVRLGIAERTVAVLQPVELSVNDREDIDAGPPRPAWVQVHLDLRLVRPDRKDLAEFDDRVSPELIVRVDQGDSADGEPGRLMPSLRAVRSYIDEP